MARTRGAGPAAAVAAAVTLVACGLSSVGTFVGATGGPSDADVDAGTLVTPTADAGGSNPISESDGSSTVVDAGTSDAADAACSSVVAPNTTGQLTARPISGVTVDALLGEWACVPFVRMDKSSAIVLPAGSNIPHAVEFAMAWDPNALYLAARVTDPSLAGTSTTIHMNDCIELYLDADGTLTGSYTTADHQYVVDHRNESYDYGYAPSRDVGAGFTSAVRTTAVGFDVEIRIARGELALGPLTSGMILGFDLAQNDGDGVTKPYSQYWFHAPSCNCSTTTCCCGEVGDHPWCNTQRFGKLTLAP